VSLHRDVGFHLAEAVEVELSHEGAELVVWASGRWDGERAEGRARVESDTNIIKGETC